MGKQLYADGILLTLIFSKPNKHINKFRRSAVSDDIEAQLSVRKVGPDGSDIGVTKLTYYTLEYEAKILISW